MRNIQNFLLGALALLVSCNTPNVTEKTPVDYVNPYMGNISHLLVPTFPTIHLPNSMLRVYPERPDYTSDQIKGLPLIVTSHRGSSAFNLSPYQGREETLRPVVDYTYDNEVIKPYYYRVYLDEQNTDIKYAPSHQSAQYEISYEKDAPVYLILNSKNGAMRVNDNTVSGYQQLENNTRVYLYLETENKPEKTGVLQDNKLNTELDTIRGNNACVALYFGDKAQVQKIRYGISFISEEQAKSNMEREQKFYDVNALAEAGKKVWNDALGKIEVQSPDENEKTIFYTSLYRCYERPVNISEDGRYFSAFDGKVHEDGGNAFYTDDWIWDTYRATHPLRVLIDTLTETNVIRSYILMAEQMGDMWMPTFPEITGDSRRMNSNHAVATVADAYGYIPALAPGEKETVPEVHHFEKRQPIAVTLGTSYDQWCLSQIAEDLGKKDDAEHYLKCSYNYRNVYNPETQFFHPKDKNGKFIEPFDYRFSGGQGAREYYGENNAWVYRWDVPHNVGDLIAIMGGTDRFIENLNQTFREPLGRGKYSFYAQLPDHTGNVGQFSMANEPSLHIPYLYNYAGQPWMTQKRIRTLLKEWFRNDLMGVPGDEDGGGMSAFVAFSSMGFYPVTPGSPTYNIGSPMFPYVKMTLSNGKIFEIIAENCSDENKYIQSATLNGKELNQPWFNHSDIANGGKLVLKMGDKANKAWGSDLKNVPPSAKSL